MAKTKIGPGWVREDKEESARVSDYQQASTLKLAVTAGNAEESLLYILLYRYDSPDGLMAFIGMPKAAAEDLAMRMLTKLQEGKEVQ